MCSGALAAGLGVGQVALLVMVVLCYPAAKVQTYMYTPCVVNGSLSRACGHVTSTWVDLAPVCGVLSLAVAAFVIDTFNKAEAGKLQEEFTFSGEGGEGLNHWNAHFWFVVAWTHCVLVFMMGNPAHIYTAAGAAGVMTYALARICRPQDPEQGSSASAFAGTLIYIGAAGVVFQGIPRDYPNRWGLGGVVLLMDYVLRVGHVWDRATTMETVANCRVMYASFCALLVVGAYASWGDDLVIPSASGGDD
jgi:hypothetical protein